VKTLDECRRHVDGLFGQILPRGAAEPDAEGRRWFAYGRATLVVRVSEGYAAPSVSITAPLVRGIEKTTELLETLNRLNEQAGIGRLYWSDGIVALVETLLAETVDVNKLMGTIFVLGRLADTYQNDLRTRFGGRPAFEADTGALRLHALIVCKCSARTLSKAVTHRFSR
jgi:hypothetical protein